MNRSAFTTLILAVTLSSCNHYYYVANVQNVPLFREKHDFRLTGAYGKGEKSECTEVQAAFSPTDNIGIMTNFMSAKGGNESDNTGCANGTYFDGAIGYYKTLKKHGVFEIYGGLGWCNQHHQYSDLLLNPCGTSDLSFTNLFVQPSLGLTFNHFDLALSTRICRLTFTSIDNHVYGQMDSYDYDDLNNIANKNYLFLEPALTIRGGWKNVKVQIQYAIANINNKPDLFFVEPAHISFGIFVSISGRSGQNVSKKE
jgi:hypothetical protein